MRLLSIFNRNCFFRDINFWYFLKCSHHSLPFQAKLVFRRVIFYKKNTRIYIQLNPFNLFRFLFDICFLLKKLICNYRLACGLIEICRIQKCRHLQTCKIEWIETTSFLNQFTNYSILRKEISHPAPFNLLLLTMGMPSVDIFQISKLVSQCKLIWTVD